MQLGRWPVPPDGPLAITASWTTPLRIARLVALNLANSVHIRHHFDARAQAAEWVEQFAETEMIETTIKSTNIERA